MKHIIYIFSVLLFFCSCDKAVNKTETKSKKLLGFKTMVLAEFGDKKYDQLEKDLDKDKIDTKYIKDIIYVSYLEELNACGLYDGKIEFIGDSIKLDVHLVSDEVCTSTTIERITFLIDNPDGKKKIIYIP